MTLNEQEQVESQEIEHALHELKIMFRYVVDDGLEMDSATRELVADALGNRSPHQSVAAADRLVSRELQIINAHNSLAKIVAPATPISLEATKVAPGFIASITRPRLILVMIIAAAISAPGFLIAEIMSNSHQWLREVAWVFASALGAIFYILFAAHEYVKNRTFDPRYNSLYIIRFVLGVISGLLLATIVASKYSDPKAMMANLAPATVAILGGFSTEAVYQILQRLVEIMLAAVRGDNVPAVRAQATETARTELLKAAVKKAGQ